MVFLSNRSSKVVEQKLFGEIYSPPDYQAERWLVLRGWAEMLSGRGPPLCEGRSVGTAGAGGGSAWLLVVQQNPRSALYTVHQCKAFEALEAKVLLLVLLFLIHTLGFDLTRIKSEAISLKWVKLNGSCGVYVIILRLLRCLNKH